MNTKLLSWLTPLRLGLVMVVLPTALASAYFLTFAKDRYVSETTVALRESGASAGSPIPGAALLLGGLATPARQDSMLLQTYVQSLALLQTLEQRFKLREHFSAPGSDFVFSLRGDASQEEFLQHYRDRVSVHLDDLSSTLTIRVQGFEPGFAQAVNRGLIEESERFVNEFSQKMAREQLAFGEGELVRATSRLQAARAELLAFQTKHNLLNATAEAEAAGAVIVDLNAQITKAEAELRGMLSYLNPEAFQVRALKSQISALREQMAAERRRAIAGGKDGSRINTLSAEFQALQMQAEFALDAYKLALGAVENSRIEASRKLKSLVIVEPPTLAQTAEYPRRLYNIATVLVISLMLYGAVSLAVATIREHQD
jgi:capsular polysaccharide transport system permease protein